MCIGIWSRSLPGNLLIPLPTKYTPHTTHHTPHTPHTPHTHHTSLLRICKSRVIGHLATRMSLLYTLIPSWVYKKFKVATTLEISAHYSSVNSCIIIYSNIDSLIEVREFEFFVFSVERRSFPHSRKLTTKHLWTNLLTVYRIHLFFSRWKAPRQTSRRHQAPRWAGEVRSRDRRVGAVW